MKKIIFILIALISISSLFARNNTVVIHGATNDGFVGVTSGNLDVLLGDATTEPVGTYFLQSISNFVLISNTIKSDVTNLNYIIYASNNLGTITNGDEILLLDVVSNREFYANVLAVTNNSITLDRPVDHIFPSNTTLGRTVTSEMAVNGSVTPQIFTIRAGNIPIDITRLLMIIVDEAAMDDGKFGGITALTRGWVFRIIDGFSKTMYNFKSNGDIGAFSYDTEYKLPAQGPSGNYSFKSRLTFAGQSKHGVVLRLVGGDVIQFIVQDDLTSLVSLRAVAQGHLTSGE